MSNPVLAQLNQTIQETGIETATADNIKNRFLHLFEQAEEWRGKASELVVTDESQVDLMKEARKARLALKNIRVEADKTRKELKEDSVRYGKAVQGTYNIIKALIQPIENHLQEQEDFAKIQEAKRMLELKEKREVELLPYSEFVPYGLLLEHMSEDDFQKLINGAKLQLQQKKEEEERLRKEEEEREKKLKLHNQRMDSTISLNAFIEGYGTLDFSIYSEEEFQNIVKEAEQRKADKEKEDERIRVENEKLRKEKAEAERKANEERKKAAEKLRKEQAAKAKLQAEIKAKKEAEEKARKEKAEAERKAKAAHDKEKLIQLAKTIGSIDRPELKTDEANTILKNVDSLIQKLTDYITENANNL